MISGEAQDDTRATMELANLLGRALVQTKDRVTKLEKQLQSTQKLPKKKNPIKQVDQATKELRQEVEKYRKEEGRLQQQVDQLKKERDNLVDKQEKQIQTSHDEVSRLECERESAQEEAQRYKDLYKKYRQRAEGLEKVIKDQEKSGRGQAVRNPFDIVSSLPLCPERPAHGTLVPIAKKGVHLRERLLSRTSTQAYADTVLFLPGRFSWCTTARTYHHALAFGPTHTFNIQSRRWEKGSIMGPLYGQTRQLFYEDKSDVFYAGTYRCIRLDNPIISWPEPGVQGLVPYVMAETALTEDFRNAPCSQTHKGTVSKLYREGVLKLECMGLQCIGFDKDLYKHLIAQHPPNSPSKGKKRSASIEEDEARKRRKI